MLDRIRRELDDRLASLKPAVEEYARLQRAADALDALDSPTAAKPPASSAGRARRAPERPGRRATPAQRRGSTPARAERAAPGQTQLRVIEQLRGSPGSSSTAVAQALGMSANAAAATISRLVKQGRVIRLEAGGYAPAPPSPDASAAGGEASPPDDRDAPAPDDRDAPAS